MRPPSDYLQVVAITIVVCGIVVVLLQLAAEYGAPGALLIAGAVTACLLAVLWGRLRRE